MIKAIFYTALLASFQFHGALFAQTDVSTLDSINGVYIPKDLNDCFRTLDLLLPDSSKNQFASHTEADATGLAHHGLGRWMRNNWELWAGSRFAVYFFNLGIFHPDDMSGIALTSYHRYLNHKELDLETQVQYYRAYWEAIRQKKEEKKALIRLDSLESEAFLQKNNLAVRAFSKGGNETHFESCDGMYVTKQTFSNEVVYWLPIYYFGEDVSDTTSLNRFMESVDDNTFINGIDENGWIELVDAEPFCFHTSGDTMYQTIRKYHLARDSVELLYWLAGDDIVTFAYCDSVMEAHSAEVDAIVFHKNLFKNSRIHTNPSGIRVLFIESKTIGAVVYHRIEVQTPRRRGNYRTMEYVVDPNFNLINFENAPSEVCAWLIGEK